MLLYSSLFFLRIHHIYQFSCTNQFLDWANFSSNFYTEIFTQQFPSSLEALFYLWKREWPGQTITSPHLTSIHTRLYRQTSFDGLETETKWVLWNKLMKHPDFLHVCRGLNYKRSRSLSLKYMYLKASKTSYSHFVSRYQMFRSFQMVGATCQTIKENSQTKSAWIRWLLITYRSFGTCYPTYDEQNVRF